MFDHMRNLMCMAKALFATSLGHWKVRRQCEPVVRGLRVGQAMEEVLWLHISQGNVSTVFFSCPISIQNLSNDHSSQFPTSSFHSCAHTTVGVLFHDSIPHLVTPVVSTIQGIRRQHQSNRLLIPVLASSHVPICLYGSVLSGLLPGPRTHEAHSSLREFAHAVPDVACSVCHEASSRHPDSQLPSSVFKYSIIIISLA